MCWEKERAVVCFSDGMSAFAGVRPDVDGNIDTQGRSLQLRDPSIIVISRCVSN